MPATIIKSVQVIASLQTDPERRPESKYTTACNTRMHTGIEYVATKTNIQIWHDC